jgi:hypothetical protein
MKPCPLKLPKAPVLLSYSKFIALLAVCLAGATGAFAQLTDNWWTVDGGGGASTGGQFLMAGTAGQPDAAVMSGGGYILRGGFWGLVATLPPRLTITQSSGSVSVCWPYPSSGYVLLQSDSLTNPNWTAVPAQQTQVDSITWCMALPANSTIKFYRLKKTP